MTVTIWFFQQRCDRHIRHNCCQESATHRALNRDVTLLQDVLATHPTECVNGLPVVDEHLRWQGCELFIMGGLAALRVGPAARNLSGAKAASDRIVPALTKSTIASING